MAHIYAVGFAMMADVEAELDDPSIGGGPLDQVLERFASPQLSTVFLTLEQAKVISFLAKCRGEVIEDLAGDEEGAAELRWANVVHSAPKEGRECWSWRLVDKDDDTIAMVVIQKVEVS